MQITKTEIEEVKSLVDKHTQGVDDKGNLIVDMLAVNKELNAGFKNKPVSDFFNELVKGDE